MLDAMIALFFMSSWLDGNVLYTFELKSNDCIAGNCGDIMSCFICSDGEYSSPQEERFE